MIISIIIFYLFFPDVDIKFLFIMDYSDIPNLTAYFRHSDQFYYILTDLEGEFVYVNPLFQKDFSQIADKEKYQKAIQQCLENPLAIIGTEFKIKSPEGFLFSIHWEFSAYSNDETNSRGVQGIGIAVEKIKNDIQKDISPKQKVEKHIQKQLIQAAIDEHEKEKQQISKELHDNINQHLATTSLYLEVVRDKLTGESFEIIDLAHKGLSGIIKEIRHLSQSLVPPTLCDIGLDRIYKGYLRFIKKNPFFHC